MASFQEQFEVNERNDEWRILNRKVIFDWGAPKRLPLWGEEDRIGADQPNCSNYPSIRFYSVFPS
ncbi:MAG: hypothetical protein AAF437_09835 [Pseudomonadota bacterium]